MKLKYALFATVLALSNCSTIITASYLGGLRASASLAEHQKTNAIQAVANNSPRGQDIKEPRLLENTKPKKEAKAPVDQYCSGEGDRIPCGTNNEKKLYVCHHEGQDKSRSICIAEEALPGHMRNHGVDYCGECGTWTDSQASCDGSSPVDLADLPTDCDSSNVITVKVNGSVKTFEKTDTTGDFRGEDSTDGSTFQYIRNENNQVVAGTLVDFTEHTVSQFHLDANGNQVITVTNSSDFPLELDPPALGEENQRMLKDSHIGSISPFANRMLQGIDIVSIHILLVWTVNAECRLSGLDIGCNRTAQTYSNMIGWLYLSVAETNDALRLSGSNTQIVMVHSELIDYTEHPTNAFVVALDELRDSTDGIIDGIHSLRAQVGADMVAMIIDDSQSPLIGDDSQYCGIAYSGPRSDLMFSVTAWNCATGRYSFARGIGQNLGCNQDRGSTDDCDIILYPNTNYGYRDPNGRFRTIMAKGCKTGECDISFILDSCGRVQRFSTPNVLYNWKDSYLPMGDASANNVLQIDSVSAEVAAFFPSDPALPIVGYDFEGNGHCYDENSYGYDAILYESDYFSLDQCAVACTTCLCGYDGQYYYSYIGLEYDHGSVGNSRCKCLVSRPSSEDSSQYLEALYYFVGCSGMQVWQGGSYSRSTSGVGPIVGAEPEPYGSHDFDLNEWKCYSATNGTICPRTWYEDLDGDGFGNPEVSRESVPQPVGYVVDNTDLNDTDASITNFLPVDGYDFEGHGSCRDANQNPYDSLVFAPSADTYPSLEECAAACNSCFCARDIDILYVGFDYLQDLSQPITGVCKCLVGRPSGEDSHDYLLDFVGTCGASGAWGVGSKTSGVGPIIGVSSHDSVKCYAVIDEICSLTRFWYEDYDGDGFGNPSVSVVNVTQPVGYVADNTDCNDADSSITNETSTNEYCWAIPGYNFEGNGLCLDENGNSYDALSYEMHAIGGVGGLMNLDECAATCTSCFCTDDIASYLDLNGIVYRGFQYFGYLWNGNWYEPYSDCKCVVSTTTGLNQLVDLNGIFNGCSDVISILDSPGEGPIAGVTNDDNEDGIRRCYSATANACSSSPRIWYRDSDGDDFGSPDRSRFHKKQTVNQPVGYVADNTDCNDADSSITNESCSPISGYEFKGDGFCLDENGIMYNSLYYVTTMRDTAPKSAASSLEECAATCTSCFCSDDIVTNSSFIYRGVEFEDVYFEDVWMDSSCNCLVEIVDLEDGYSMSSDPLFRVCKPTGSQNTTYYIGMYDGEGPIAKVSDDNNDSSGSDVVCYAATTNTCSLSTRIWYRDWDGDGFGNPAVSIKTAVTLGAHPEGYVVDSTDCNDDDNSITNELCSALPGYDFEGNGMCLDRNYREFFYDAITYGGILNNAYTAERCANTCNSCFCADDIITMTHIFYAGFQLWSSDNDTNTDCECLVSRPSNPGNKSLNGSSFEYLDDIWHRCNATQPMAAGTSRNGYTAGVGPIGGYYRMAPYPWGYPWKCYSINANACSRAYDDPYDYDDVYEDGGMIQGYDIVTVSEQDTVQGGYVASNEDSNDCVGKSTKKQCEKDKICQWNDDKTCTEKPTSQLKTMCVDIKEKKECKQTGGCHWKGSNGCVDPDIVSAFTFDVGEESMMIKSSSDHPRQMILTVLVGLQLLLWK